MERAPVVAGQFYTADAEALRDEVRGYLALADETEQRPTLLAMVPHAGYVFSGPVAGKTLGEARLARRVVLLGPNHTGRGRSVALWNAGSWRYPGGALRVDDPLARALEAAGPHFTPDAEAHVMEHSLEVVVPFLAALDPQTTVVPVAVAENRLDALRAAGEALAEVLRDEQDPVSIVVSSDMSHFVSEQEAKRLDSLALEPALDLDPERLYDTVRSENISMCGVLPMTMALFAVRALGATGARLTGYATSAAAGGDASRVVGYAGIVAG